MLQNLTQRRLLHLLMRQLLWMILLMQRRQRLLIAKGRRLRRLLHRNPQIRISGASGVTGPSMRNMQRVVCWGRRRRRRRRRWRWEAGARPVPAWCLRVPDYLVLRDWLLFKAILAANVWVESAHVVRYVRGGFHGQVRGHDAAPRGCR